MVTITIEDNGNKTPVNITLKGLAKEDFDKHEPGPGLSHEQLVAGVMLKAYRVAIPERFWDSDEGVHLHFK